MDDLIKKLSEPFPVEEIEWRVGSTNHEKTKGMALAYIDARSVMDRLDSVCGAENWQNRYSHAREKTVCEIGIKIENEWVWKADGAGDTDFEAEKGALSDSFKRAAVRWGIGRYLYSIKTPWVAITQYGKSYKIVDSEIERLYSFLPNSKNNITVSQPIGLSKTPAKFWDQDKLIIPLKKEFTDWTPEAMAWWKEKIMAGIEKAPTRYLLARLQTDNHHIIDKYTSEETFLINEAFSIRAEQLK